MMRNIARNAVACAAVAMLSASVYAQEEKGLLEAYNITGFQTLVDAYDIPNGFNPPCPVIRKRPYRPSGKPNESSVGSNVDAWNEWTPENVPSYCREETAKILTPPDGKEPPTRF